MLARQAWIDACRFERGSDRQTLDKIELLVRRTPNAVVLFDLDHTVYRNALRTRAVLHALLPALGNKLPASAREMLLKLEEDRMGFSLRDTFRMNGLMPEDPQWTEPIQLLRQEWWPKFFSNEYMQHDAPYPGAPEYCARLAAAGARVVYLSARDEKEMGEGTRRLLARDKFPLNGAEDVWLKADKLSDSVYKAKAIARCLTLGNLVASFENEPANIAALAAAVPATTHVFLDTVCSDVPAIPVSGVHRIRGWA